MFLLQLHAGGLHFDVLAQLGLFHASMAKNQTDVNKFNPAETHSKFNWSFLAVNFGYRWLFGSSKFFLDWDFLSGPSLSIASFKVGKICCGDKLAVYGILTPITWLHKGYVVDAAGAPNKSNRMDYISSLGFDFGAGVGYKVAPNVSLIAEGRMAIQYPGSKATYHTGAQHDASGQEIDPAKSGKLDKGFLTDYTLSVGVQFHSEMINQ